MDGPTVDAVERRDDARATPSWARRRLNGLRVYARRNPLAVGFALVIVLASVCTGSLWGAQVPGALGWGAGTLLNPAGWWAVVTALVIPDSPVDAVLSILLALTALAATERILGSARTLIAMGVTGVVALLVGAGVQVLLSDTPEVSAAATQATVLDPAIAITGALLAASALAGALWRRRIRVVAFAVLGMFALYAGDVDSWYRLIAALTGLALGLLFARGVPRRPWHRSSTRETRSLVATIVAVTGLGPIAALIAGGGRGPLSLVATSFAQFDQEIVDRCTTRYVRACDHQFALLVTRGVGPALLAIVPLVLLLVAAWGLRSGRRAAWMIAVGVNAALALLAIVSVVFGQVFFADPVDGAAFEWVLWAISTVGVPVGMLVTLLATRRRFQVHAPRAALRVMWITIGTAFVLCIVVFLLVESLVPRAFVVQPGAGDLLIEAVRRFIPPAFLQGIAEPPFPRHGAPLVVYQWTGVAFWLVAIIAILRLNRATSRPADAAAESATQYRALLRRGGGTLSFLGTWQGNEHWFSDDAQAAVAYRVVNGVALAVADPLCTPSRASDTVRGFAEFAIGRGWTPVFYSIHDDYLPAFAEMGWHVASVGQETVMHLPELEMVGKEWQKVRHPLNRAEREGMTAVWTSWRALTPAMSSQIAAISEQWVTDRALPEMGFTLGGIEELADPDVALLLAVDADGRLRAVTSWLPSWRDGVRVGWTLDFMRREAGAPNGVMEFLIAKAALLMKEGGLELLSLSGAPLAAKPIADGEVAPDPTTLSSFLAWLGAALEPVYGFASLFRFKSKFHPAYRTLYMAYADPVSLPAIGSAVGRAYLPDASPREYVALVRSLLSGPAPAHPGAQR
ncbi:bifunctional lysylphosphatidylglycerol flippase/synthetase MprF [uncultured Microbacterium sp.]|uniref:bifunctional lysylphosphatidylglycerol flippase/synthetase MprF n=1 Tax=uncultured Microbacterium sp. TaxID=191216 RepID=UPI0035C9D6A2